MIRWLLASGCIVVSALASLVARNCGFTECAPVVDGALDDECWAEAEWTDGFFVAGADAAQLADCRFAVVADSHTLYFGFSAVGTSADDRVEFACAPTGSAFDFYRFAITRAGERSSAFFSESGNIQPDPFAPEWSAAVRTGSGGWTVEFAIPFAALYCTRNRDWSRGWLINASCMLAADGSVASWSPLTGTDTKSSDFQRVGGFPVRAEEDDVAVTSAEAEMAAADADGLHGRLTLGVFAAIGGDFVVSVDDGPAVGVQLASGDNQVEVPCDYPTNGRFETKLSLSRVTGGTVFTRWYPVLVDYQPLALVLTRPAFKRCFYPWQDASRVEGTVRSEGAVELRLEGPGFATRELTLPTGGDFTFDTAGFAVGTAVLTIASGTVTNEYRVRRLEDTGRLVTYVEDGRLMTNGVPVFRRGIYAPTYMTGDRFGARLTASREEMRLSGAVNTEVTIEPNRLVSGIESIEAKRDVRPCDALFAALDEKLAANRGKDFGYYYICDEPECRSISPVYLRYIYDYVAERDPYHVVAMATRGGARYRDCADLLETHPYLNASGSGESRRYGHNPRDIAGYLDAFDASRHPDKCIGFLPTAFGGSSRWNYPTFDEYENHVWAALLRGARTLWPYAAHDLGDRPRVFAAATYMFQSAAALEDFLLCGDRVTLMRDQDGELGLWELNGERLLVAVNFDERHSRFFDFPDAVSGELREFRGERRFSRSLTPRLELPPLGTLVMVSGEPDAGLAPRADVTAAAAAAEAEQDGRDNQLLYANGEVKTTVGNLSGGASYKLMDGNREVMSLYRDWSTNTWVQFAFTGRPAVFRKVRVWGKGLDGMSVEIRRDGDWVTLEPVAVTTDEWMRELDFGETNVTVKMKLHFPGTGRSQTRQLYEVELPEAGEASAGGGSELPPIPDEGVSVVWDEHNCPTSTKYSEKAWYKISAENLVLPEGGGFLFNHPASSTSITRFMNLSPSDRWIVVDFADFRKIQSGYCGWSMQFAGSTPKIGHVGGQTSTGTAGVFTLPLPPIAKPIKPYMQFFHNNFLVTINRISAMTLPATRVEIRELTGASAIRPGGRLAVEVHLARPCIDMEAEFLYADNTGNGMTAYRVNGTSAIDLRCADGGTGRVWRAEFDVKSCAKDASARYVYVRAIPLGGDSSRPVLGNTLLPFRAKAAVSYDVSWNEHFRSVVSVHGSVTSRVEAVLGKAGRMTVSDVDPSDKVYLSGVPRDWYSVSGDGSQGVVKPAFEYALVASPVSAEAIADCRSATEAAAELGLGEEDVQRILPHGEAEPVRLERLSRLVAWAQRGGVSVADVQAFDLSCPGVLEKAYLLNVRPQDVPSAEADFRFESITPGELPRLGGTNDINGSVILEGRHGLVDGEWESPAVPQHSFYRARIQR